MSEEEIEKYFKHIVINGGVPFKNLQEIFNLVEDKCNIIKFLQQENKELKGQLETYEILLKSNASIINGWSKLKEYLEDNWKKTQDIWFVKIINKMKEIEGDK